MLPAAGLGLINFPSTKSTGCRLLGAGSGCRERGVDSLSMVEFNWHGIDITVLSSCQAATLLKDRRQHALASADAASPSAPLDLAGNHATITRWSGPR